MRTTCRALGQGGGGGGSIEVVEGGVGRRGLTRGTVRPPLRPRLAAAAGTTTTAWAGRRQAGGRRRCSDTCCLMSP
jgi:hypothetical protein